uniref:EF-hand domain-containing protein n=1 Tax=Amazona collaria TaxID=241587 RepID=A0A8B9FIA3_9PSIT
MPSGWEEQKALKTIVDVYHRYSIREGELDLLNFNDFKTGHANTCPAPQFQNRNHPDYLNKLFQESDLNKDKDLSFEEFTIVLAKVTDDAHRIIHKDDRCTPDKD